MQNALLDIIIIGVLVLLFASTYRKRTSSMVRSWTFGWLLILLHFAAALFHPATQRGQALQEIVSITALIACGIVFLIAAGNKGESREPHIALPLIAGASGIVFTMLEATAVHSLTPYLLSVISGSVAWMLYAVHLRRTAPPFRVLLVVATLVSAAWMGWTISHGQEDVGISAVLFELFFAVAIVHAGTFRRLSGGTLTVVFGLVAWAAVFPCGEFCDHLHLFASISPELWNVPKYFVAFGMILILLEEEIIAANGASQHYRVLFDANPHPMWIYDRGSQAFQSVNDAALLQYGYSRDEFLAMSLPAISAGEDPACPQISSSSGVVQQHRKSDGSLCFVDVATHRMQSEGRDLAFSLVQDVTERQQLHNRLSHQAHHDLLTGLANRAWLEAKLRDTLAGSGRHHRLSALICLDLDRFKQINDTYGHGIGDLCLKEVARRLAACLHGPDVAARIGGEEFSLLLHEISSPREAELLAEDILACLRLPIEASTFNIELSGSIGIALYPADGSDAETLWRNADCAMYRAKRAGGNQYLRMSTEIGRITSEANEMEHSLRVALKGDGLEIEYQPLFGIGGELHSLEALVRFRHPANGLVYPARFVPVAEESGLIVPLGDWVLDEVCRQTAAWQREGVPPVRIAINISPLQITRPDFAAHCVAAMARHNVDPHLLGMEITETAMMRNVAEAARQIKALADLGVVFSVDDFGTGYSSLGQLDKFAVNTLKIDRTFIERICRPDGTYSIVDAIISMAHSLRLEVVAEGVETQEQWACLRDLHCDTVQGFLLGKPLAAVEVPAILVRHSRPRGASVPPAHGMRVA